MTQGRTGDGKSGGLAQAGAQLGVARLRIRAVARASGIAWALALVIANAAGASAVEPRIDAIFVIDNSGSMKQSDPGFITRRIVEEFARELPGSARLGLVLFGEDAFLLEPLSRPAGTAAAQRLAHSLGRIDYSGRRTDIPAAVERALYELRSNGRDGAERAIILLTDGVVDTGDRERDREKTRWLLEDLVEEGRRAQVRIFGIAFTERADYQLIQALATRTGGNYFRVQRVEDIPVVLAETGAALARAAGPPSARETTSALAPEPAKGLPAVASAPLVREHAGLYVALGTSLALIALLVPAARRRLGRSAESAATSLSPRRRQAAGGARLLDVARVTARASVPLAPECSRCSIGRALGNDVVIPHAGVSSFHATLEQRDGYFHLEDQRSTNGTFLNGRRLHANRPVQLKSGDRIDFANFEFRFLLPEQEPIGRTVLLAPACVRSERAGAAAACEPDPEAAFRRGLELQIEKIRRVGPSHAAFAERNLTPDRMQELCATARDLLRSTQRDGRGHTAVFARGGILHSLCAVPVTLAEAPVWFGSEYGGYAKFLAEQLASRCLRERDCETLCVICFGAADDTWVSISVLPGKPDPTAIELVSFELLCEAERRAALAFELDDAIRAS